jgi:alpha-1,2-mannosyltransferase
MAQAIRAIRDGSWLTHQRMLAYALIVGGISVAVLGFNWMTGPTAMTDRFGRPLGTDFFGIWTAGRMLLSGDPYGMFDPARHFAFQQDFMNDPNMPVLGWHYPPFFLAVAVPLAMMPYVMSLLVWQGVTLAMFAQTVRRIAPAHPLVLAAAIGFPAVYITVGHGHNSFLTACLLGFGLLLLDRRPIVAGVLIGLLAYKPQFGIVLPIIMVLGGHWRATIAAAAAVIAMVSISTVVLGFDVWAAFAAGAHFTRGVILEQGATGWHKIQTVFSAMRSFGGSIALAYAVQALATAAVLLALAAITCARADKRLIASATCIATMLATPYSLDYDMTILGIAIAFSVAHGVERGFAPYQKSLLALVWFMPMIARTGMLATGVPIGVLVMSLYFLAVISRALRDDPLKLPSVDWSFARG